MIVLSDVEAKKKNHPGCLVWWFAPGCPLANVFGADPFHIYPWEKFCVKYSDFKDTKFCENVEVQEELDEKEEENMKKEESNRNPRHFSYSF